MHDTARETAPRPLGLATLVSLIAGNAIGAGVYTTSGFALADLGSRELVLWAWAAGGAVALIGALSYGLLARRITESGGEYVFLARNLHPAAGSVAGWVSLLAGFTGAIAFAATTLETYARAALPAAAALPANLIAVGIIVAAGLIHGARTRSGAALHDAATALMLGAIAMFLLWAGLDYARTGWPSAAAPDPTAAFALGPFIGSLTWVYLSYSGYNAAVYVAGEARDAHRNVPRAMVVGVLLVAALYLGLNAVFLYAAPPAAIAGQPEVAAIAAGALGGPGLRRAVEGMIVVSLLTSVTAMVLAGPRVYAKMADDGALPALFRLRAGQPPRAAIALQVVLAAALVLLSDLRGLLGWLGLTLSLSTAFAVSTLFWRHWCLGERPASALYPVVPALYVAVALTFGVVAAVRQPEQFWAAAATLAAGVLAWALGGRRRV